MEVRIPFSSAPSPSNVISSPVKEKPIVDPIPVAMKWTQYKNPKVFLPPWLHKKWKNVFIHYEQTLGFEKAKTMLYMTPSYIENRLTIKTSERYRESFEKDIKTLEQTIRKEFGYKTKLEYQINIQP